jgi:hypothetical protein
MTDTARTWVTADRSLITLYTVHSTRTGRPPHRRLDRSVIFIAPRKGGLSAGEGQLWTLERALKERTRDGCIVLAEALSGSRPWLVVLP